VPCFISRVRRERAMNSRKLTTYKKFTVTLRIQDALRYKTPPLLKRDLKEKIGIVESDKYVSQVFIKKLKMLIMFFFKIEKRAYRLHVSTC